MGNYRLFFIEKVTHVLYEWIQGLFTYHVGAEYFPPEYTIMKDSCRRIRAEDIPPLQLFGVLFSLQGEGEFTVLIGQQVLGTGGAAPAVFTAESHLYEVDAHCGELLFGQFTAVGLVLT